MQHPRRLYQAPSNEVNASGAVAPEPGIMGPDDALFSDAPTAVDPPDPDETGAAANVTIVLSAQDLQRATATGAVDIEIRAHLDLRGLWRRLNPAIPGHETLPNNKRNALLYAQSPLRSIRGNCTDPDASTTLSLSADESARLLPLRQYQCMLLFHDTFLMVNNGNLWIDNLYLRVSKQLARPTMAFINLGRADSDPFLTSVNPGDTYVTRTTFQPDGRGTTIGITADTSDCTLLVDDCIFTDWVGFRSPFVIKYQSVFHIRDTVLRNFDITSEIADVSFEGIVHFQNVSLANVSLAHGNVVGTTLNDYNLAIAYYLSYYAEEDYDFDVELEMVAPDERSMWGEEFRIVNKTMSDCVYLLAKPGLVYPGCPEESLQRRESIKRRSVGQASARELLADSYLTTAGGPLSGDYGLNNSPQPASDFYYDYFATTGSPEQAEMVAEYNYEYANDPGVWFAAKFLDNDDPWLVATQEVLPSPTAASEWPAFVLDPPPQPHNRSSLLPYRVPPGVATGVEPLVEPLSVPRNAHRASLPNRHSFFVPFLAVAAVLLVALAVVGFLLRLWLRASRRYDELQRAALSHRRHARPLGNSKGSHQSGLAKGSCGRIPLTPMNPDYEYNLPPQLSLLVNHPCTLAGDSALISKRHQEQAGLSSVTADTSDVAEKEIFCLPIPLSTANCSDDLEAPIDIHSTQSSRFERDGLNALVQKGVHSDGSTWRVLNQGQKDDFERRSDSLSSAADNIHTHQAEAPYHSLLSTVDSVACCKASMGSNDGSNAAASITRSVQSRGATARAAGSTVHSQQEEEHLHLQLNMFHKDDIFLGRFEVLGRRQRRRGGQAIIQFVMDVKERCEYAVKFFLDREAFLAEAALYAAAFPTKHIPAASKSTAHAAVTTGQSTGAVTVMEISAVAARFLPQVQAVCDETAPGLEDPHGNRLPPCIVMEKGESLNDWSDRAEPDLFTALAVLSNIAHRMVDMHAAGYVHRDLKPANIMWLPRQNRWTLIDFGCVARNGSQAPLSFTLAYAAPEVVAAYQRQEQSIEASTAQDAWSLGVLAFELLTGAPAFNMIAEGRSGVTARLLGHLPLPWEGKLRLGVRRRLGVFLEPVLQLLQREPSQRMAMCRFHSTCSKLFARHTTTDDSADV